MKKLFLRNGGWLYVKSYQGPEYKGIAVYEDEKPVYSVQIRPSETAPHLLYLKEGLTSIEFKELSQMSEIMENFNQYFNLLNQ